MQSLTCSNLKAIFNVEVKDIDDEEIEEPAILVLFYRNKVPNKLYWNQM